MNAIKHSQLDCRTFAESVAIPVTELEDLSMNVPHVGYGGASKSCYISPNSGQTIYVLERNGTYAPDAWINDVWQFDRDFTAHDASDFLKAWDKNHAR